MGAGCAKDQDSGIPASLDAPPAATADAGPEAAAASKAALAAYAGYLDASREAEKAANPLHPALKKYLADPLLTQVRLTIRDAKEHGAMRTGTLISDPRVTDVRLDTVPATAEIQDCLDGTGYRLIYTKDKSVVPGSASGRYLATATATRYPDGRWLISAGTAHRDQPC
ncbi:hypothetical protein ACI2K4_20995 [Micromonospora sp. NPDC050397]|uniref:hypothetical protein n=1 Tax=Micromonospora sp. NPDC050397 TaxID=3364279 RepID=UPI00384B197E